MSAKCYNSQKISLKIGVKCYNARTFQKNLRRAAGNGRPPECAARMKRINAAKRKRKQREKCHALGAEKPL